MLATRPRVCSRACAAARLRSPAGDTTSTSSRGSSSTKRRAEHDRHGFRRSRPARRPRGDSVIRLLDLARGRRAVLHALRAADRGRRAAPTSATCRATAPRSTTRACWSPRCWPASPPAGATPRSSRSQRRGRGALHGRPPAPRRLMALRGAPQPRLGRQLPHGLRPRRTEDLRRRRGRRSRGGRGVDEGARLLPAGSCSSPMAPQVLLGQALPDRRPIGRAGNPDAVDRRAARRLARVGAVDGVPISRAAGCSAPTGSRSSSARRLWTNPAPHVRWVVAPMLLALTHLLAAQGAGTSRATESRSGWSPEMSGAIDKRCPPCDPTAPPRRPPGVATRRVTFVTDIPTPYMLEVLKALAEPRRSDGAVLLTDRKPGHALAPERRLPFEHRMIDGLTIRSGAPGPSRLLPQPSHSRRALPAAVPTP